MPFHDLIIPFGTAILIGALIGIEREKTKQDADNLSPIGVRTSILISLFGAISAYLGQTYNPILFIIAMIAMVLLTISSHIFLVAKHSRIGVTTEISSIIIFLCGAMAATGQVQLAIIVGVITTLVLSLKDYLHGVAKNISNEELYSTIKFAIIAFIILPFLPDQSFDQAILGSFLTIPEQAATIEVLNPYRIWLLVVFVSGISYIGYILVKLFGKKVGVSLSGLMGGLYSSTATSLTLAQQSKKSTNSTPFVAGIILASAISFLKTFIFIRTLNEGLFNESFLPLLLMFLYLLSVGLYLTFKHKKRSRLKQNNTPAHTAKSPFRLQRALKVGSFIVAALLIAKISLSLAGVEFYYLIATLSAFFAVDDPIVISTAAAAGNLLNLSDATNIILLVTYLNMAQKAFIMYFFGNKKFVKPLAITFGGLLLVTAVGFLYL